MKIATVAMLVVVLLGCGVTRQARDVKQSGFLGDYSMLKPGPDGGALMAYQNPDANIKSYDKILLEPVTIWMGTDSEMKDLAKEDRQRVADELFSLLHARLSKDYQMVQTPQPGTMRIAAALTSAESSYPILDTVSTIIPVGAAVSILKAIATGKPAFVGEATAEMKITDATTDVILLEAVDRRVGTKNPTGFWNEWEDVDAALTYWANRTGYKLCMLRGATGCVEP